jgi:hypothetical protein
LGSLLSIFTHEVKDFSEKVNWDKRPNHRSVVSLNFGVINPQNQVYQFGSNLCLKILPKNRVQHEYDYSLSNEEIAESISGQILNKASQNANNFPSIS